MSGTHKSASYVFGTLAQLALVGEAHAAAAAARAVLGEFDRLHWKLHAWKAGELVDLNRKIAGGAQRIGLDPELASLLRSAIELSRRSEGLFDPAIGGLVALWNFHSDEPAGRPPRRAVLQPLLAAAPRMSDLALEGNALVCTNRAVQLDLGGYAKGYALDRARTLLREHRLEGALLDLGGQVMALGRCGERPWAVGLRHPRGAGLLGRIELEDGEVLSTSGDYERFFRFRGRRYGHVLDPRTGRPAQGAQAATVLLAGSDAGAVSDAASSALLVAGPGGWRPLAGRMGVAHALLVDAAGGIELSGALRQRLETPCTAPLCRGL